MTHRRIAFWLLVSLSPCLLVSSSRADPEPLQRIQLPPDRLAAEMERVRRRVLTRLPPCPVATLELDLPADTTPQADRDGGLVSGPFPAAAADRQLWRVSFPGRPGGDPVPLVLQRPPRPGQPGPLLRPVVQTTLKL